MLAPIGSVIYMLGLRLEVISRCPKLRALRGQAGWARLRGSDSAWPARGMGEHRLLRPHISSCA